MKVKLFSKASVISFLMVILLAGFTNARSQTITGTVTDAKSEQPLPGVNIVEKGTSNGTISDINGKYSINVINPEASLEFSFVGYVTETVVVDNRTTIDLSMVEDIMSLDQVVVVAHRTINRKGAGRDP